MDHRFNLVKAISAGIVISIVIALTATSGSTQILRLSEEALPSTTTKVSAPAITVVETTSTTSTTSTVVTAPPPTILVREIDISKYKCPQWYDLAISVGWSPKEWPKLSKIMWRESRCKPQAWNKADPTKDGSRGLTQINGFWCRKNKSNPIGWLQARNILMVCADLHNPEVSLRATLAIWQRSKWRPWGR